jgi:alginate O-acetyltransferase complex protein AlgI
MSFVSAQFLVFFAVVWLLYWRLPRQGQNLLLVCASVVFYGWMEPWMVLLLAYDTLLCYGCALGIARQPKRKRLWLLVAVVGALGLLGVFKYFNFFVGSVAAALQAVGVQGDPPVLHLLLPLGISFYTFQTLGYVIDVYWGKQKARTKLLDVATFTTFFPLLVSGPIERAGKLLTQVERERSFSWAAVYSGLSLALWGALQKVVVADTLSPYVNAAYAIERPERVLAWSAAIGFTVQMVADFTGYTNIARGVARTLGIELVRNFRDPYLATDPQDFWRRWHLSLSDWLRDYVFNPLYGSTWLKRWPGGWPSEGARRVFAATVGTMLLSGLWHGAAWHFIAWGGLWATALVIQAALPKATEIPRWRVPLQVVGMWVFNVVAHQLFRESDPVRMLDHFAGAPWDGNADSVVLASILAAFWGLGALILAVGGWLQERLQEWLRDNAYRPAFEFARWTLAAWIVYVFAQTSAADFLYFQF